MVGIAVIMLALVVASLWQRWRGELFDAGWFLWCCTLASPLGFVAVLAGWATTEVGRQPWTVYGLLRTANSVSPSLTGFDVAVSLAGYCVVYLVMFPAGLALMNKIVQLGPAEEATHPSRSKAAGLSSRSRRSHRPKRDSDDDSARYRSRAHMDAPSLASASFSMYSWTASIWASGILYRFAADRNSRNLVMNSIAPIWDGNETWLVLGGLALMGAFPLAFAIIIPAVYFPIAIMLLALCFRGVAFEFRYRDAQHRTFWDHAFNYGFIIGAFAQGVVLGAFIQGFQTEGRHFAGGSFDCFTPFSLLTGVALVFGYSLLGAGWLILKTEGALQDWARALGRWSLIGVLIGIAAV